MNPTFALCHTPCPCTKITHREVKLQLFTCSKQVMSVLLIHFSLLYCTGLASSCFTFLLRGWILPVTAWKKKDCREAETELSYLDLLQPPWTCCCCNEENVILRQQKDKRKRDKTVWEMQWHKKESRKFWKRFCQNKFCNCIYVFVLKATEQSWYASNVTM